MWLYWSWFILFSAVGWFFAYKTWIDKEEGFGGQQQLYAHGALTMSLVMSWPALGGKIFNWILGAFPQADDGISQVTALVVIGVMVLAWVALPVFVGLLFMNDDGDVSFSNFRILKHGK